MYRVCLLYTSTGQPSTCAVPCAWLAAEERHKSGRKLIAAIIAAYEVYQRIALAVQPSEGRWREKGWGMQNWQIFAAIIPIAKLYGLDTRKINQDVYKRQFQDTAERIERYLKSRGISLAFSAMLDKIVQSPKAPSGVLTAIMKLSLIHI